MVFGSFIPWPIISSRFCNTQRYALEFAFHHVITTGSGVSSAYAHLQTSPGRYRAALAFQFGIQLLLRDAENAISDGVHAEVRRTENSFGSTLQSNQRIANLNEWLLVDDIQKKFSHYSPQYRKLVYAITDTSPADGHPPPLPGVNRLPITPHVIGQSLFVKANKAPTISGRPRIMMGAPLFRGGAFNHILPALVHMVCDQMSLANPSDNEKQAFVGDTATQVLNHLRITLLPWSDVQSGSDSAYSVFNSWITIATSRQSTLPSASRPRHPCNVIIVSDDETWDETESGVSLSLVAPHQTRQPPPFVDSWVPSSTSILDLPAHLLVKLRPDELEHIASEITTMKDVVQQNYNWAFSAYSAQNPIHKLAFIISSVMFRMAPSYMVATKSAPRNQPPPWTSTRSSTRRPLPSGPICFGLWLVYLLTMLDSSSPLRSSLQTPMAGRRVVLGADWVDSMSKSFSYFTQLCTSLTRNTIHS